MLTLVAGPKLDVILRAAGELADVSGAFAECGVYQGGSLAALAEANPQRTVYGFDTFEGLPQEAWAAGEPHGVGDFGDTNLDSVKAAIGHLSNVDLRPGIFPASAVGLEAERFALLHLDFDFYESTRAALEWFLPRMSPGGVIVFDDVDWPHCPGVRRAIEEFGLEIEITAPCQAIHRVQS
ncbi:TylF/MycF/NovP-related O-methyltransferase [Phenylobacterium sp.]|uniref:TylF/MycF/NovP-related O-methyltransferase n=1 Tax=Phenylobacterium sp. TaxID=1871053 RepID=UPI0019B9CD0E|nr:TylF/MycF/NovP-related O-methyltransferase [Phenylobacterium sp.]MBC7168315.1 class I SAM-dependent methyltransferase [Phenylobacterium sp.]